MTDEIRVVDAATSGGPAGPRHRVRLPRFVLSEPVGLGELAKRGTTAVGLRPCDRCRQRAARMDRWVGFEPTR